MGGNKEGAWVCYSTKEAAEWGIIGNLVETSALAIYFSLALCLQPNSKSHSTTMLLVEENI